MNWDAISAIAEVTGTVGIIVSLIYLGFQIRSQTVEARITGLDNAVGELNNIYESLSGDEKFAALFLKALQDFDSLSDVERIRFSAHMSRFMRGAEAMFHRSKWGRIDDEVFAGITQGLKDICTYPGTKSWWLTREHWFSKEFRAFLAPYMESKNAPIAFGGE
jgi:hypothetical protein